MKKSQQSLKNWTAQKWRTSDGSESKGKKRYLPDAAWDALSSGEKAATNRAKAEGNKKGKQFVAQPEKIKEKTKSFRQTGGESPSNIKTNDMKNLYKKGGKNSKSSFLEESKEVEFGYPKPMKYEDGGKKKERLNRRAENQMGRAKKNWENAQKALGYDEMEKPETSNAIGFANKKLNRAAILEEKAKKNKAKANEMGMGGKKSLYKKGGFPDLNKDRKTTFADVLEGRGVNKKKAGGEKSMEPGGGGRFAKMVSALKKKGKSEESAKAIAASVGRKKYGKSKFQEMAAKGRARKKEEGGFEDDEMEVEIEMNMLDKGKKNASAAARKRGRKARRRQQAGRTGCWSGNCKEGMDDM